MKKIYALLFVFFASVLSVYAQDQYYVASSGGLNLRQGPGAGHEVVTSVPQGSKVVVLNQENEEWWKVKYDNKEGYVSARYLSKEKPENNNSSGNNRNSNSSSNRSGSSGKKRSSSAAGNYNYGIGLRAGDPSGLTFIKFLDNSKALEFNVGRTAYYGYDFKRRFDKYDNFDGYVFQDARFRSAVGIQLHYLTFKNLNLDGLPGLQWYYGIGAQVRVFSIDYYYQYRIGDDKWANRWERASETDFGIDGTLGLNYNFQEVPLSVFADFTLFGEIYDNPLLFWGQGGFGIRYNF